MVWEKIKGLFHKEVSDFWALTITTLIFSLPLITIFLNNFRIIGFLWGVLGWYILIKDRLNQFQLKQQKNI